MYVMVFRCYANYTNKRDFSTNQNAGLTVIFLNLVRERGAIRSATSCVKRKWKEYESIEMSADIDSHISQKYEIKKRLGKGVCLVSF